MTEFWTMEKIDRLFVMVREGYSFSLIGAEIGCTRNAAIGKYNRTRVARGVHTRKPRPKIVSTESAPRPHKPAVAPQVALPVLRVVEAPRPPRGIGVSIVEVSGCRYAVEDNPSLVGGMSFCNDPVEKGGSYCAAHARIVYTKPPKPGTAKRFMMPVSLLRMGAR